MASVRAAAPDLWSFDVVAAAVATAVVAIGVALASIERRRLPRTLVEGGRAVGRPVLAPLRAVHSGHVGDYIAWLTVGMATFGGILAVFIR